MTTLERQTYNELIALLAQHVGETGKSEAPSPCCAGCFTSTSAL